MCVSPACMYVHHIHAWRRETGRGRCSSWSWGSGWLGAAMETVWPHVHHDMQAQIYIHTKCSKTQKIKSVLCRVCRSLARTLGGGGSLVSLHFRGTAWPLRRTSSAGRSVFGYIALSFLYILCIDLVAFFSFSEKTVHKEACVVWSQRGGHRKQAWLFILACCWLFVFVSMPTAEEPSRRPRFGSRLFVGIFRSAPGFCVHMLETWKAFLFDITLSDFP